MNYTDNKKLQKELALALIDTTNKQKQAESTNVWFAAIIIVIGLIAYAIQ